MTSSGWLMLSATLALGAAACPLTAGGGDASCKIAANGVETMCQDYLGYGALSVASLKSNCTTVLKGAFSDGRCSRAGSIGACGLDDPLNGGAHQTYWYFPGFVANGKTLTTPADVMEQCARSDGGTTYQAP